MKKETWIYACPVKKQKARYKNYISKIAFEMISDFLGTTLGTVSGESFRPVHMTAFGEQISDPISNIPSSSNGVSASDIHSGFGIQDSDSSAAVFYTGKPYDEDLQSYHFLYRNYSPTKGRWTAADPSGFPDGPNQWLYVNNSVTGNVDPLGLETHSYTARFNIIGNRPNDRRARAVWRRNEGRIGEVNINYNITINSTDPDSISYTFEIIGNPQITFRSNMSSPNLGVSINGISVGMQASTGGSNVTSGHTSVYRRNPETGAVELDITVNFEFEAILLITAGVSVGGGRGGRLGDGGSIGTEYTISETISGRGSYTANHNYEF
ncbi:RHS repeat-associated core domain-containing protein [Kamptonema cortianum]|nr:RHS repeat-associated core domain-containing protein [Kamptonema cortianum]